ncbi:hypothetical protein OWV82_008858 [Melia azedarach]|uniref:Uncharacterized protein n=1 Tax=Melia azedarach TaxID=155640 RepID=A0ACC1YBM8_MELAZ|nr:hypothetical protein OWV82_008858 [Melia azedarach]
MENPKPKQVKNYPENGEMKYLFRKKLSKTDTKKLLFVQDSTAYLEGLLPESIKAKMNDGVFEAKLYTQKDPTRVFIKRKEIQTSYYLQQTEWRAILSRNEFKAGD